MRLYFSFVLVLLIPIASWSQADDKPKNVVGKISKHHIVAFGTILQHFNKNDIKTQGTNPFLTVQNTRAYLLGIDYEFKITQNTTMTVELASGQQEYNMQMNCNFNAFDPTTDLSNRHYVYDYQHKLPYLRLSLNGGYEYLAPIRKIKLIAKVGIGSVQFFGGGDESWKHGISYYTASSPNKISIKGFANTDFDFGSKKPWYQQRNYIYSFYTGIGYPLSGFFVKELRIGLSFTHYLQKDLFWSRAIYFNSQGEQIGTQIYTDKFRTLGITAGIVF